MLELVAAMQDGRVDAEPALVLSNKAEAGGLTRAAARSVPTAIVDHRPFKGDRVAHGQAVDNVLNEAGIELLCLAGWMRIMSADFMERWAGRILNIHPSLLPSFPGLNTHQRAIDTGCVVHGCTVHKATPVLDEGPILGQAVVPVLPEDTADTLAARVLAMEHQLYPQCLARFVAGDARKVVLGLR